MKIFYNYHLVGVSRYSVDCNATIANYKNWHSTAGFYGERDGGERMDWVRLR